MSDELLLKILFSALYSILFGLSIILPKTDDKDKPRYTPFISGMILPFFLFLLFVLSLFKLGVETTLDEMLSLCFPIFLDISIYYILLIFLLPVLRKMISSRACAILWLIPNYLYITQSGIMKNEQPFWIIHMEESLIWNLFSIWLTGFLAFLLWKIISHLRFRRQILKNAYPVLDKNILKCWNLEYEKCRIKKRKYKLIISPAITTPLSIGLFHRTIHVVLPVKNYTTEEMTFIFRHELIHICMEDSWSKFFMMFCTAVCWFNPLMWYAMKKSADDLELSCDETVLLDSDDSERSKYASLILDTAGDERGFTTCLSASARALRYRLSNILGKKKRFSGAIMIGIISFILFMSSGYISLAYETYNGSQVLFDKKDSSSFILTEVTKRNDEYNNVNAYTDHETIFQYLSNLTCEKITGNYAFSESERSYFFHYETPDGSFRWFTLTDHTIKLFIPGNNPDMITYYLAEPTDWNYLDTLIIPYPALKVKLEEKEAVYGKNIDTTLYRVYTNHHTFTEELYKSEYRIEDVNGIYGYQPVKANFFFSQDPIGPYTVRIESWDKTKITELSSSDFTEPNTALLPNYTAYYSIMADFSDREGDIYTVEFRFNVGTFESE